MNDGVLEIETGQAHILKIMGMKFSIEIFEDFAFAAEEGTCFKFINREDGVVTLERLEGGEV